MIYLVTILLILSAIGSSIADRSSPYQRNIYFNYYQTKDRFTSRSNDPTENVAMATGADPNGKVNVIIPGYQEDCRTPWVTQMVCNFNTYRSGATFCMDYSVYSKTWLPFMLMLWNLPAIGQVFANKLHQMELQGFDLSRFVVFGFSSGAKVAIDGGAALKGRIGKIYSCEYPSEIFAGVQSIDPKTAGKRVQGIHTSNLIGTVEYNNHVDFLMGHCGLYQDANGRIPYGDHGLCPYFFNCAFRNRFRAMPRPAECRRRHPRASDQDVMSYDESFAMGWQADGIAEIPNGVYYANTTLKAPYNTINDVCATTLPSLSKCCSACY